MDLVLETPGTRLGKRKDMLKISVPNRDYVELPFREIESIIVGNGVQITSQALKILSSYAVNIVYTSLGNPYGIYTPFANNGTVFTRRQQLLAYEDWRGLHLGTKFVYATIENKRRLLMYFAKNRKKTDPKKHRKLRFAADFIKEMLENLEKFSKTIHKGEKIHHRRRELMGIEGRATAIYFREFGSLMPKKYKTFKRSRRPPKDPVNSLLSLGYTVLLGHVTTAIASAGLELYGGFLHSDRSGKPSLALDLLEEFRQPVIDRFIARLFQKAQVQEDDFENSIHGYRLKDEKKSFFYKELKKEIVGGDLSQELFGAEPNIKKDEKAVKLNFKKQMIKQSRKLANFLIGATSSYEPFIMNW
ncbi:MAG: CRISPR-associated endonuclease Cas1 [Candidatus Lokiarchaeota archaeon]|nr:CRISPR-associated endonuclease Cas1 [Candidatus Lokiarchaeota archaeon]MBD3202446.1 CRISPR-associated endonuclease Cas1 [Candidatus Lokiarchaeota archaeon]